MNKRDWLARLHDLLAENPDCGLTYTRDDDGVHVVYGADRADRVNLGFTRQSALTSLRQEIERLGREGRE